MSHFTVGVIVKEEYEVEQLLEPYSENEEVEPYITKTKEEIISKKRAEYKEVLEDYPTRIEERKAKGEDYSYLEEIIKNAKKMVNKNDEAVYKDAIYEDSEYDEEGNELSTYNPDSKWDWYSIGGRWSGLLLVKDTIEDCFDKEDKNAPVGYKWVNGARIKDIEFAKMEELKGRNFKREWELLVEKQEPITEEDKEIVENNYYNPSYFTDRYEDKETYAKLESTFLTYALLTEDGWFEQGQMGWFGCDNATKNTILEYFDLFKRFIKENADKYLIIVDCHI